MSETYLQNVDEWHGCYAGAWKGLIVPDAIAHPAKFGASLVQRMLAHALDRGWLAKGDLVLDPFGGIDWEDVTCFVKRLED